MKREKRPPIPVTVQPLLWTHVLKWEDEPVLTLTIRGPGLPEDTAGLRRVGRYYNRIVACWRNRWEVSLYKDACESAANARASSRPFQPWEGTLDYTVTYNQDGLLSIYLDAYEYAGGAHGVTLRCGDTWEPYSGTPRTLRSFFPQCHWRRLVLDVIKKEIGNRIAGGESLFFDDWVQRAEQNFSSDRFWLSQEGLCIFYPLYTVAPYAEGIPIFSLPLPSTSEG